MKKVLFFLAALIITVTAWATSLTCSIDDSYLLFTGRTRTEWGKLLYQHKCLYNHYYWLTQEQMDQ